MTHDPTSHRKEAKPDDFALNRDAIRWLASLPEDVRPIELGRKFPRIINTIAAKMGRLHRLPALPRQPAD